MNKFLFKSTDADFQKLIASIDTIQKNVLYLTYRTDMIIKMIHERETTQDLQTQVDEFYETSPQTESETK